MASLSLNQTIIWGETPYVVVDEIRVVQVDPVEDPAPAWRWFLLREGNGRELIVEDDGISQSLCLPDPDLAPGPTVDRYSAHFGSTTGEGARLNGTFPCSEASDGSMIVGSAGYRTFPVLLGDDRVLRLLFIGGGAESWETPESDPDPGLNFEGESKAARIADYVGLGVLPLIGLCALFATPFNFTLLFLVVGAAALFATKYELGSFRRTLYGAAVAAGFFMVASPVILMFDFWGSDMVLMATLVSIVAIPIALNHHGLLRDLRCASWWTLWTALLVPTSVLLFWCVIDEDFGWFSDWLDFYYYCSFILPVMFLIAAFEGGRRWLRSFKKKG
jgi:hypothetical protein